MIKIYLVGGAVRDKLLGLQPKDRDFVVVGSTPEQMLAEGFKQVGKTFPVFLDEKTGEEYALARTEVKNGVGYNGFNVMFGPEVTLEEDLRRRDLTINAIAIDEAEDRVIDPYKGVLDLQSKILRHVSEAFAEDPLRVLRLARFAARLGFTVAPETAALAKSLVEAGELDDLTAERVYNELKRGLTEAKQPWRFLEVLQDCGALKSKRLEPFFRVSTGFSVDNAIERLKVSARHVGGATASHMLAVGTSIGELDKKEAEKLCVESAVYDSARSIQMAMRYLMSVQRSPELTHDLFVRQTVLARNEKVRADLTTAMNAYRLAKQLSEKDQRFITSSMREVCKDYSALTSYMVEHGASGKEIAANLRSARILALTEVHA